MIHRTRVSTMVDPLRRLLRRGARSHAANLLKKLHPADVARLLPHLDHDEALDVFALLLAEDPGQAGEVLTELEPSDAVGYLEGRSDEEVARILAEVGPDDAAELVTALPEDVAARVLEQLERKGHEQVEDLLGYPEETAGRIMSPEVFALHEDLTVSDALLRLPWLFAAWIGGVLASQVINNFEGLLGQVLALTAFIPIIVGMGGR